MSLIMGNGLVRPGVRGAFEPVCDHKVAPRKITPPRKPRPTLMRSTWDSESFGLARTQSASGIESDGGLLHLKIDERPRIQNSPWPWFAPLQLSVSL